MRISGQPKARSTWRARAGHHIHARLLQVPIDFYACRVNALAGGLSQLRAGAAATITVGPASPRSEPCRHLYMTGPDDHSTTRPSD
jgi:hypothetical protein